MSRWLDSPVRLQLGGAGEVRLNNGLVRDVPPSTNILGTIFMVNAFREGRFYTTKLLTQLICPFSQHLSNVYFWRQTLEVIHVITLKFTVVRAWVRYGWGKRGRD